MSLVLQRENVKFFAYKDPCGVVNGPFYPKASHSQLGGCINTVLLNNSSVPSQSQGVKSDLFLLFLHNSLLSSVYNRVAKIPVQHLAEYFLKLYLV